MDEEQKQNLFRLYPREVQPGGEVKLDGGELSRHIRGAELELVFSYWLGDLARARTICPSGAATDGLLARFVRDIRGAQINLEAVA